MRVGIGLFPRWRRRPISAVAPPVIDLLSATSGEDFHARTITAEGSGFTDATSVKVDGDDVDFEVNADDEFEFDLPDRLLADTDDEEEVEISITTPGGTYTATYTYLWSPHSETPAIWRRSDRGATLTDGDTKATEFLNYGSDGADGDLVLRGGDVAPNYTAPDAGWNGQPSVNFVSGKTMITRDDVALAESVTMVSFCDFLDTGVRVALDTQAPELALYVNSSFPTVYFAGDNIFDGGFTTVGKAMYLATFAPAGGGLWDCTLYRNATLIATGQSANDPTGSPRKIATGTNNAANAPLAASWVEDIVWRREINANVRARLAAYKTRRYG